MSQKIEVTFDRLDFLYGVCTGKSETEMKLVRKGEARMKDAVLFLSDWCESYLSANVA